MEKKDLIDRLRLVNKANLAKEALLLSSGRPPRTIKCQGATQPAAPKETRQNPQLARQASGGLAAGTTQQRESDFAQKGTSADANLIDSSDPQESLPQPAAPKKKPLCIRYREALRQEFSFTTCSDPSSSMDGLQSQSQQGGSRGSGTSMARKPIWKSSFRKADDISSRNDPLMSSTPQLVVTGTDRELEELVAWPAHTADERYRILDCRDKIIRESKVLLRIHALATLLGLSQ